MRTVRILGAIAHAVPGVTAKPKGVTRINGAFVSIVTINVFRAGHAVLGATFVGTCHVTALRAHRTTIVIDAMFRLTAIALLDDEVTLGKGVKFTVKYLPLLIEKL